MAQATVANGTNTLDDDYGNDLEPDSQRRQASLDRERDLNIFRSGSAPPTVEGSTAALDSLFCRNGNGGGGAAAAAAVNGVISEEEMMMISNPDYLSYYNYNKNLNPRLPPPSLTKDEWILMQRFKGGAVGDRGSTSSSSFLFSLQPGGISINHGSERGNGGFDAGRKSFAEALQGDLGHSATLSKPISRPGSRSVIGSAISPMGGSDSQVTKLQKGLITLDDLHFGSVSPRLVRVQSLGSSISQSFASGLDSSPSRSMTPDPQLIRRSPSPSLPPIGSRIYGADKKAVTFNGLGSVSSHIADSSVIASSLADLSFSDNIVDDGEDDWQGRSHQSFTNQPELLMRKSGDLSEYMQQNLTNRSEADSLRNGAHPFTAQNGFLLNNGTVTDHDISKLISNGQIKLPRQTSSNNLYSQVPSVGSVGPSTNYRNSSVGSVGSSTNVDMTKFDYSSREVHSTLNTQLDPEVRAFTGGAEQHLNRAAHQMDPLYAHYIKLQAAGTLDPIGTSVMDLSRYPKAYLEALLAQQKLHHGMPFLNKSGGSNHGFYGNLATGLGYPYPTSPTPSSTLSSLGTGSPLKQNEQLSCFPSMVRGAGSIGSWNTENGLIKEGFVSSLLDEFKIDKSRSFELSEIVGHVVEFSVDQYGSRFIQQQLETAAVDEKDKIFTEILLFARDLMTDVFGNYVIQKFFEHGTEIQRKQLASQLMGHVLPLSFQMYGCRVIQKALEVVDVDQQTQMVAELDGSVMKCVHDQNGNHVIQKCIECVPQEKIQFIISAFYGQVVTLSTHPYGCRVIQRVLEHCDDAKIQSILMDEILQSVCTLSKDQYGNYVVQHVLQHGKQEERSAIIRKLAGQIVNMSQQKFASNVVEKCLTYGSPEDRQLLINEMLGSTDENEPLQVMMKDQFGNYVVQKVLETCNDENHELILSRIRVHLNTLKRYTYGKHIVVRVEKLLATGERRSVVAVKFS